MDNSFQSTPPVKAATLRNQLCGTPCVISIHAAREGGDASVAMQPSESAIFQSTPPVKAATTKSELNAHNCLISIHAAREGGDPVRQVLAHKKRHFNPRRP